MPTCRYQAVVTGSLSSDTGVIDTRIEGKACGTQFEVVRREFRSNLRQWVTVVDLWPRTGRKHQLRIHLASIGHPIVGDYRYRAAHDGAEGAAGVSESVPFDGWLCRGLYLWALELGFEHPESGERMHFSIESPEKYSALIGRKARRRRLTMGGTHAFASWSVGAHVQARASLLALDAGGDALSTER